MGTVVFDSSMQYDPKKKVLISSVRLAPKTLIVGASHKRLVVLNVLNHDKAHGKWHYKVRHAISPNS